MAKSFHLSQRQSGNTSISKLISAKLTELRKAYLQSLAGDLLNPVVSGQKDFIKIGSRLDGIKAVGDTLLNYLYPEAVAAAGGIDILIMGDLLTLEGTQEENQAKVVHALVHENFLSTFALAQQIAEDLNIAGSNFGSRAQILPKISALNRHRMYVEKNPYYLPSLHLLGTITKLEAARKVFDSGN